MKDDTDLGLGLLVVEFGEEAYQPLGVVISVNEAREIAGDDMRRRMRDLDAGKTPACPESYVVWARGIEGKYIKLRSFMP